MQFLGDRTLLDPICTRSIEESILKLHVTVSHVRAQCNPRHKERTREELSFMRTKKRQVYC